MGLFRFLSEDRMPAPGDAGDIVVVDLATGEQNVVAKTRGWDTQMGAQVQWGATDAELFFNDMDPNAWGPFGVKFNPLTGDRFEMDATVYMVSRDGKQALSPCLLRTGATQAGYGVIAPGDHVPTNQGAVDDDGIYITDTTTGKSRLLVSIREIVETAVPRFNLDDYADGDFYGFHVKWNPQGDRIMFVLRWVSHTQGLKYGPNLITMRADGSEICCPIQDEAWSKGGHHPDWCPDGETVMMNLRLRDEGLSLVRANYDGSNFEEMTTVHGSGHPTLHPNGRHILTDVYLHESLAYGDGTTPLRWIDVEKDTVQVIARINNDPPYRGLKNELRIDPHPAWDRDYKRIAFNICDNGVRRVCVADMSGLLEMG
jgi:Tol biopolymer transport system component